MCTKGGRGQGFINYPPFGDSNNISALLAELLSYAIDTWYPQVLFWTRVQLPHVRQRGCVWGGAVSWNYIFLDGVSNQTEEANNTNSSQTKHVITGSCLYHKHLRAKSTSATKLIKCFLVQELRAKTALIHSELCCKVIRQTQVSRTQCQDSDLATVAPAAPAETLEHLENPLVSGWQPGWEKVSDLSDTQMCGLLPVRGYEAGITH